MPKKRLSHEEYVKKCNEIMGDDYVIVSHYEGVKKNIDIKHVPCGNIYSTNAGEYKRGNRVCRECYPIKRANVQLTHQEFCDRVYQKVGSKYTVVGEYWKSWEKIKMKHNICGYEYEVTPNSFVNRGNRCPRCGGSERKHKLQYRKDITFTGYYVYRFLDENYKTLYVGKTEYLERRLYNHFYHGHLPKECYSQVKHIQYLKCNTLADMCIKEIFYVNSWYPDFNSDTKDKDLKGVTLDIAFPNDIWEEFSQPIY